MRVAVLYNLPVLAGDDPEADSEQWVATTVDDVARLLTAAGFCPSPLGIGRDLRALKNELAAYRPDVVFNLFEGLADRPASEVAVARLLEQLEIPFTGSGGKSLWLALNKHRSKRRLRAAGLPTPWWRLASEVPGPGVAIPWPVIVKPAERDASEGIDQASVVTEPAMLARRVAELVEKYGGPVLIEQFLPGREFTVSIVETPELVPLPIAEVQFTLSASSPWPILSYAAKWLPGSPDYEATVMQNAAPLPLELSCLIRNLAVRAYRAIGCRDYARIDLRMTVAGEPMILEVNPNPDMSPTACFAGALAAAGLDRAEVVANFVRQAHARGPVARTLTFTETKIPISNRMPGGGMTWNMSCPW